jgi:uncharacterized protein
MKPLPRPLPVLNQMNRYFWQSGADRHLRILRCHNCGRYHHPYVAMCASCHSRNIAPAVVSGRGKVFAVSINHQPWFPDIPVPYAVVLVELEEQEDIRLMSNIVGIQWNKVVPGMDVVVCFEAHGEIYVPLFRPI